ncbi:hypothetical protein [Accumulibacter sp.]|uniref:hypothetical protein n=1 Tax=Accumulibacter sp. TaxID=2053492 RepID=UPI00262EF6C5|nr:hypothetical protein [Accumulibacter sp.]
MNNPWQELRASARSASRQSGTDGPLNERPGAASALESEQRAFWQRFASLAAASLAAAPREPLAVDKEVRVASGTDPADPSADPAGQGLKTVDGWLESDDAFLVLDRDGDGRVDRVGALSGQILASDGLASPVREEEVVRRTSGEARVVAAIGGDLGGNFPPVDCRIDVLLQAMAAFAPPPAAQSGPMSAWQDAFAPVLVAANGQ